jgi:MarR family transcriptional regulator for hemolysin
MATVEPLRVSVAEEDQAGIAARPFPLSSAQAGEEGSRPAPDLAEIGLSEFAPYLLNRLAAQWNASLSQALQDHGISTVKMRTLAVLSVSPRLTINELSVLTVTEQSTLSRTLDAMEAQDLVRREARRGDGRVREVRLTEAGRAAFAQHWPTMFEMFRQMFDGIAEAEYRSFVGTLQRMLGNIGGR